MRFLLARSARADRTGGSGKRKGGKQATQAQ